MLLRASGLTHNRAYDLGAVTGAVPDDGGVAHGRLLIELAEAVVGDDAHALAAARAAASDAMGSAAVADAAAVVGLFNAIDRVADATGIPLEAEKAEASADFRAALGVDRFDVSARL